MESRRQTELLCQSVCLSFGPNIPRPCGKNHALPSRVHSPVPGKTSPRSCLASPRWWSCGLGMSPEERGQQGSFRDHRVLGPQGCQTVSQTQGKGIPGQDPAWGKAWRWEIGFLRTLGGSGSWAKREVPPRDSGIRELTPGQGRPWSWAKGLSVVERPWVMTRLGRGKLASRKS